MQVEICEYVVDKVINGVLCYATDAGWVEYTAQELTQKLAFEQDAFSAYIDAVIGGEV